MTRIKFKDNSIIFLLILVYLFSFQTTSAFAINQSHRSLSPPGRRPTTPNALQVTPQRASQNNRDGWHFFSKEELRHAQVKACNGALCHSTSASPVPPGHYMYFLSTEGNLYIHKADFNPTPREGGRIYHSSFDIHLNPDTRSGNCEMAGEMLVSNSSSGNKIRINNDSGHYKPPFALVQEVEDVLKAMGYQGQIIKTEETW